MSVAKSLSNTTRSALVAAGLGAATATMLAAVVLPGWAQNARSRPPAPYRSTISPSRRKR